MSAFHLEIRKILTSKWLPWILVWVTLFFVLLYEVIRPAWTDHLPRGWQAGIWLLIVLLLVIFYSINNRMGEYKLERQNLRSRLDQAEKMLEESYQRMEAVIRLNQHFVDANDENEAIEPVLQLMVRLSGADGATFVPFDEHGQPQSVITYGAQPVPVMEAWLEYLASPGVRERCGTCGLRDILLEKPQNCPLLKGPFANVGGLLCLPVRRGEREFGVINLFIADIHLLDERTHSYLRSLVDETAVGLEGLQLRRRELATLRQMQVVRRKTDLKGLITQILESVHRALEADFAIITTSRHGETIEPLVLVLGDFPAQARPIVDGFLQGVITSGESILLGDLSSDSSSAPTIKSLMAVPLLSQENDVVGALMIGNRRVKGFHPRQLALLRTVAGQVALIIHNAELMAELEYKTMMQERTRLAREIHDGLAQTIGFLKLQASQLRNYLARGDMDNARQKVDLFYETLSEAYQDARQAIDDLRISPHECGIGGWLEQIGYEFQDMSGLPVSLDIGEINLELSSEVNAQLVRILQEALSNIRKHAQATKVWIACRQIDSDLFLEIQDNGDGFHAEDIILTSRHGIRGMRERSELIGADFQVISKPNQGTIVRLRLPVNSQEGMRV